ncbi:MAG: hypothetical protein KGY69_13220 [Bacteroidales bacterium]|nr:hypothetical protein [Candidatus Cloacimonadota bacterium]MBS3771205.1 hypothetical protein [Bacteroidales bacterium]
MISSPIIVLGFPRSGTSLTAGLLHQHGVWVGICRGPDPRNPKGFFENQKFTSYLKKGKPITYDIAKDILYSQGYKGGPWLVKHSVKGKWNMWNKFNPLFILCFRDIEDIIESQRKVDLFKYGSLQKDERKERKKINETIQIMEHISKNHNSVCIKPAQFIDKDFTDIEKIVNMMGLEFNEQACLDFIDPDLWKRKQYASASKK